MWSSPVKQTAPDGSTYHLLLLDTEGIESYDQTGQYSTQIFSLAVLLSSLFVFNQMGGIDEAALDNLALVTEMTKHIRVKAEAGSEKTTAHELGQYSPAFIWLLRDFYLDLTEEGRKITPRDYLETALNPVPGTSKAIAAKNEIRDSIRALFPHRDCFALVRPLNEEKDLQRLDQVPVERLRPEFRKGLESLTQTVFERARPKRMGSSVLTGPILAALTQSYLEALNAGAVPTIATSWQGVEEQQCRIALDAGHEAYSALFNKSTNAEEVALQEAHRKAVVGAVEAFNQEAIGAGVLRQQFESRLVDSLSKQFEEHKARVWMEAELRCSEALSSMEARLQANAAAPGATLETLLQALDGMLKDYTKTASGPAKWPRLADFLHKSLRGAVQTLVQTTTQRLTGRISELEAQQSMLRDSLKESRKQLETARSDVEEWKKRSDLSAQQQTAAHNRNLALETKLAAQKGQLDRAVRDAELAKEKVKALEDRHSLAVSAASQEKGDLLRQADVVQRKLREVQLEASEWRRKAEVAAAEARQSAELSKSSWQQERTQMLERHENMVRKKEAEIQQLKQQHEEEVDSISHLNSTLKDRETELQSLRQALSTARLESQDLHMQREAATSDKRSAELALASARSARAKTELELQQALQAARQSESSKVAAELQARREAELALQARQRADVAEQNLLDLKLSLQDKTADVEARLAQTESLLKTAQEREDAAKSARLAVEEQRAALEEQKEQADTLVIALTARAEAAETLLQSKDVALEALQATQEGQARVATRLQDSEAVSSGEIWVLRNRVEDLEGQLGKLTAKLEAARQNGSGDVAQDQGPPGVDRQKRLKRGRVDVDENGSGPMEEDVAVLLNGKASKRQRQGNEVPVGGSGLVDEDFEEVRTPKKEKNDGEDVFFDTPTAPASVAEKYKNVTKADLKQQITTAGFAHEMLALRNPSKGDLIKIYEKHVV